MLAKCASLALKPARAALMDCAFALALVRANQRSLKSIMLKPLVDIECKIQCSKQHSVSARCNARLHYAVLTKKFDKKVLVSKTHHNNLQSNSLKTELGHIQIINKKKICQVAVDANQIIERVTPASLTHQQRLLNFIVDKSESMTNKQNITTKLISAISLQTGLNYEISGYTTRHWLNSNAFKLWSRTRPHSPGRVNDVLYIKYGYGINALKLAHKTKLSKENVDGEAIAKLIKSTCINIVINDNAPADYVTSCLNAKPILIAHWKSMCAYAHTKGIKLMVINLGQRKLAAHACINLNKHLNKHKISGVTNKVLKLNAF
ncbi:MAG: hypothetical protein AAI978_00540 [Candidatus Hodgkinia cicadicola]